jgi:hypothetical protein
VSGSTSVSVTFSESMNQTSAQNAFTLDNARNGSFSWTGNTMRFQPSSTLAGGVHNAAVAGTATDAAGNPVAATAWSFTVTAPTTVFLSPSSVAKTTGGTVTGTVASLNADDNSYYHVASSNRVVEYVITFQNIPLNATNVQLLFKGKNSRSVSQTIRTSWTGRIIDTRNVSSTEVLIQKAVPGSVASTLTVTIRTSNTSSQSYAHDGDLAQLSYTVS